MDFARETFDWSVNKVRTDPFTFVLCIYAIGLLPAALTSLLLTFVRNADAPWLFATVQALTDAAIWPLKVAGF